MTADTETIAVPGLSAPASISVDEWGIAHIQATSMADLFFTQGFNAARDRLWQIDLWRKRGLGLLAADFGPGYLEQDIASRLFLYRGDMAAEWDAYGADMQAVCEAFVKGINAYVDLVLREPARLPREFQTLHSMPSKWRPEDVVRIRSHALSRNALSEVARANVMARSDAATDLLRQDLAPATVPVAAEALDLAGIPMDLLDVFRLATAGVSFSTERLSATLEDAPLWRCLSSTGDVERSAPAQGSNNWVVGGSRTRTGRPILANDPHRALSVPSVRTLVHLSAPGIDVIGAGEPNAPGISLGHNGSIAFGLTVFTGPDQEDVYVYETRPGDPDCYRYGAGWEAMATHTETVAIKGHPTRDVVLKFTRHGPVVYQDIAAHRAFAVRSVWFEPGSAPYLASLQAMQARNFDAFRACMARWAVPTVNQVYADVPGNIAWMAAGRSPLRRNWSGLLPVPGDGRFEWEGWLGSEHLPWTLNPAADFIATANEMNVPPQWSLPVPQIGFEWIEESRARRLHEVLARDATHTVAASCALQNDVRSLPAQRLCRLLDACAPDAASAPALALLQGWSGDLRSDSAAAALFEVWQNAHLRPRLLERLGLDAAVRDLIGYGDTASILRLLEQPDRQLGPDPVSARDALLRDSLAAAYHDCAVKLGDDVGAWAWGRLHQAHFVHAVSAVAAADRDAMDVGPFPQGGSESTPMNSSYRDGDCCVTVGASVRLVIDVGNWDASKCINVPGQSGNPDAPHYADLAGLWAAGNYVPLLYSRAAIAEHTTTVIVLAPATDAHATPVPPTPTPTLSVHHTRT